MDMASKLFTFTYVTYAWLTYTERLGICEANEVLLAMVLSQTRFGRLLYGDVSSAHDQFARPEKCGKL